MPTAPQPRRHKHLANHEDVCIVGTCPACREPVLWDEPDGPVWTCPADLSPKNPYWQPALIEWTDVDRERMGYFGNCLDDTGDGPCYELMPLHSKCSERGNY